MMPRDAAKCQSASGRPVIYTYMFANYVLGYLYGVDNRGEPIYIARHLGTNPRVRNGWLTLTTWDM